MFVQSLSNIWSIHHTAQVRLLSSNLSYAVFTAQCSTATNKGRQTLFNGTNLFLVMKWGRKEPIATALRVRKGPLCTLNRPSPLNAMQPFSKMGLSRYVHFRSGHSVKWMTSNSSRSLWRSILHSPSRPLRNAKVQT